MPDVSSIDLTEEQHERIGAYAQAHELSLEEAAARLASQAIQKAFVLPKTRSSVAPMKGLKRGNDVRHKP